MQIGFFENKYLCDGKPDFDLIQSVISRNKGVKMWILPEAFDTGCNVNTTTELNGAKNIDTFVNWAKKYDVAVAGSFYIKNNELIYNRFCCALPDGQTIFYDKRHLFGKFEKQSVTPGNKILTFNYLGFKFCPIICYDLRFPVWCRNTDNYDILLCVSQWPVERLGDRAVLCKARAIENQCFVINVNAQGFSKTETPLYNTDIKQIRGSKSWVKIEISAETLAQKRKGKPYLNDRDKFSINY